MNQKIQKNGNNMTDQNGNKKGHNFVSVNDISKFIYSHMEKIKPKWCPVCEASMNDRGGTCWRCNQGAWAIEKAKELLEESRKRMTEKLGGKFIYEKYTAENYTRKDLLEKMKDYPLKNYYIFGEVGCGKTHLATAIIRKYEDMEKITPMSYLRKFEAKNPAGKLDYLEKMASVPLLIDELEVKKEDIESVKSARYMQELINMRYERGEGGMIITSNLSLTDLSKITEFDRVPSRIAEFCTIIKIEGADRRLEPQAEVKQADYNAVDKMF